MAWETIQTVAETGVDYISSSTPITRSTWLDLSMSISSETFPAQRKTKTL